MAFDFEKWDSELNTNNPDNKMQLYETMKSNLKNGEDSNVLWRLTQACVYISIGAENLKNNELHKKFCFQALTYGEKACNLGADTVQCHKWYCAALGRAAAIVGKKERIKYAHLFKKHSDVAIRLNPNDFLVHFMYGRWCYEVARLTWIERNIAKPIFGTVPTSSFTDAMNAFSQSDKLKPKWKDNYLWMAKSLIALKMTSDAKLWVDSGLALSVHNMSDELAQKDLTLLKNKYNL